MSFLTIAGSVLKVTGHPVAGEIVSKLAEAEAWVDAKLREIQMPEVHEKAEVQVHPDTRETCGLAGMQPDVVIGTFCQSVVDQYAREHGLKRIDVVVTRNVPDACADVGITWFPGDETIYINPDFANKDCRSDDQLAGAVLHEAGHAYAADAGYSADIAKNYAGEYQADMFAARAMDDLGYDRHEFAELLKTFGPGDETHPPGVVRAEVVESTPHSVSSRALSDTGDAAGAAVGVGGQGLMSLSDWAVGVWLKPYPRMDGALVSGYFRSWPDGNPFARADMNVKGVALSEGQKMPVPDVAGGSVEPLKHGQMPGLLGAEPLSRDAFGNVYQGSSIIPIKL